MLPAHHSLHFRVHTKVLVTLAVALLVVTLAFAEPAHRTLLREAQAAAKAQKIPEAIALLERAAKFAPDYPRLHWNLARFYAEQGRHADALHALRTLADMGLVDAIDRDPALTSLRGLPEFADLATAFQINAQSVGSADSSAWAITGVTGIIESVAMHPTTLESFFGDVHHRCIWYRDVSGPSAVLKRFSADTDGLLGVFALKFSPDGNTLWASSSALPEMAGYTEGDKGRALLAAYDLATRKLRRTFSLPADGQGHVLGDFAIAPDGAIYASDSTAPIVWRLAPGADTLEKWAGYPWFVSLQGVTLSADGKILYVADYANGIWRIDTATKEAMVLKAPTKSTLFGIDGLYSAPGALIAVQNGVNPARVLRIDLTAAGEVKSVRVLVQGHPKMTDVALGQIVNGNLHFVADSGWSLFEKPGSAPAPRNVIILSTPL